MATWRILGSVGVVLCLAQAVKAQTYPLSETPQPGDCYRIHIDMNLSGELRINKDGKRTIPLPLTATATHEFPERVLIVGTNHLPQKAARCYEAAKAAITVDGQRTERTLRLERQVIVAQREKDQAVVYSPAGPLTFEELELTGEHFDTLALAGLLPGKAVAVGETWKVPKAVAQSLCSLDGLHDQDLTCKLVSVHDQLATVSVSGTANGIQTGAESKLTIQATYRFDLVGKHLTWLEWKQKDELGQAPANPASVTESTTTLKRTAIEQPACLDDVALVSVPEKFEVPPPLWKLSYPDAKGRFDLVYDRKWRTLSEANDHLVLRLMDDGDYIAQATVTPWRAAEAGKHLEPEDFAQEMADTPGWEPGDVLQEGEVTLEQGCWGYRITAPGTLDGLKVVQTFYLVAAPSGAQVVVAFTMTPAQAEKLGTRDLDLVRGLAFKK